MRKLHRLLRELFLISRRFVPPSPRSIYGCDAVVDFILIGIRPQSCVIPTIYAATKQPFYFVDSSTAGRNVGLTGRGNRGFPGTQREIDRGIAGFQVELLDDCYRRIIITKIITIGRERSVIVYVNLGEITNHPCTIRPSSDILPSVFIDWGIIRWWIRCR